MRCHHLGSEEGGALFGGREVSSKLGHTRARVIPLGPGAGALLGVGMNEQQPI